MQTLNLPSPDNSFIITPVDPNSNEVYEFIVWVTADGVSWPSNLKRFIVGCPVDYIDIDD